MIESKTSYWRFYWPLALMGMVMLLGRQFQQGTLARYPDAKRQLATFELAMGVFVPFRAVLAFMPQMTNVFARSNHARRLCRRFVLAVCLLLTVSLGFLAFSGPGRALIGWIYGLQGSRLDTVVLYLRYLMPLVLLGGLRQYYSGLLIQSHRTGLVTILNVIGIGSLLGILVTGFRLGWPAVETMAASQFGSSLLLVALTVVFYRVFFRMSAQPQYEQMTYREALKFFWPVAITSLMFAFSRPIIYSFLNRMPDGESYIAALGPTFALSMMFHNPMNQFRHLFVTFGTRDLAGMRRFMTRTLACMTALMILVAATPLSGVIFESMLNLRGDVLLMARQALLLLCVVPMVITFRNYFHGLALTRRRTVSMATGAILRNLAILWLSAFLWAMGWLNHLTAAGTLVAGFVAEGLVGMISHSASRRGGPSRRES